MSMDVLTWEGKTMSRTKANNLPERAFRFLNAIAQRPVIFLLLSKKGFTEADFHEGKGYLQQVSFLEKPVTAPSTSKAYQEALLALDNWDEENFLRTSAALENRYPEQYAFLFAGGLQAARGPESIRVIQLFLDRVEILMSGTDPSRQASQEQDKNAMELLYRRGILSEEIVKQLRAWIATTTSLPNLAELETSAEQQNRRVKALFDLDYWFSDWSQTARAAIQRRDYLISLGLAARRKGKDDTETDDDTTSDTDTSDTTAATPSAAPTITVAPPSTATTLTPPATVVGTPTATVANPPKA